MPAPCAEDAFFLLYNFSFFVKNQVFIGMWIQIRVFDSILLVHLPVSMPILRCFYYCSSVIELDIRHGDAFRSSCIMDDCLALLDFLSFRMKLSIAFSSVKNCAGIFFFHELRLDL